MTKHGRNATNSAVYSYSERQKDAKESGYGTDRCRLGKDSLKGFDCCCLTLQPCREPLVSPEGWLFDKEAVLRYILKKKSEHSRQAKERGRQREREERRVREAASGLEDKARAAFESGEKSILPRSSSSSSFSEPKKSGDRPGRPSPSSSSAAMPSFWIPSLTPDASKDAAAPKVEVGNGGGTSAEAAEEKQVVLCPMSGKPLKFKSLIPVQFVHLGGDDDGPPTSSSSSKRAKRAPSLIARVERFKCAVTHDILNNSTPVAVLRPTGHVVTVECVDKIIKKDMIHPLTGQHLKDKDIIYLQRGGTGFSAANVDKLDASKYRPNLAIS